MPTEPHLLASVDPVSREAYHIQESKSKTGEKGIHSDHSDTKVELQA